MKSKWLYNLLYVIGLGALVNGLLTSFTFFIFLIDEDKRQLANWSLFTEAFLLVSIGAFLFLTTRKKATIMKNGFEMFLKSKI